MRFDIEGTTDTGAAIDLRERPVDREALIAAIYGDTSPYAVDCPTPGPVHQRAGVVVPDMGLKVRTAVAAAARSRGIVTPHDDRIDRLATKLAERSATAPTDLLDATDALAAGASPDEIADLRERAAELRGQVATLETMDADPTDARAELRETAARLSELETERIAAAQTRERARELREGREERLRLEDRLANARRDARATLVERVRDEYEAAVTAIVAETSGTDEWPAAVEGPFSVAPSIAALGVLRVAVVRAPVVLDPAGTPLEGTSFAELADAADWLDVPVIRL